MKYFLILFFALCAFAEEKANVLFTMDLSGGLDAQFTAFQDKHYGKVIQDSLDSSDAIAFDQLSKYTGLETTNWIKSPSKNYQIIVYFRGDKDKTTGGYIGYESKERPNILIPLASNTKQFINLYQQQQLLSTEDNEWQQYVFFLSGKEGIKIYFEQGTYFGINTKYYCAFKGLIVSDPLITECPIKDEAEKVLVSYQFGAYFAAKNFKGKVTPACVDNGETVDIRFSYPPFNFNCLKTDIYALNTLGKVIEKFAPERFSNIQNGEEYNRIFTYNLTLSELNDYGCKLNSKEGNNNIQIDEYECPIKQCFYLDYGTDYPTKQTQYDWVSKNSYAIFTSSFRVQVNKETSTIFNSLIQTYVNNQVCGERCYLDMSLSLQLYVLIDGEYVIPDNSKPPTLIWGEYMHFKITSKPSDYDLSLTDIYIQTLEQQAQDDEAYLQLGQMFIDSFIQNTKKSQGEITFSMMASGEAGLDEGKPFNIRFLIQSDAATRRRLLEETYGDASANLPSAQINDAATMIAKKKENNAFKLGCSLLLLAFLFLMF